MLQQPDVYGLTINQYILLKDGNIHTLRNKPTTNIKQTQQQCWNRQKCVAVPTAMKNGPPVTTAAHQDCAALPAADDSLAWWL